MRACRERKTEKFEMNTGTSFVMWNWQEKRSSFEASTFSRLSFGFLLAFLGERSDERWTKSRQNSRVCCSRSWLLNADWNKTLSGSWCPQTTKEGVVIDRKLRLGARLGEIRCKVKWKKMNPFCNALLLDHLHCGCAQSSCWKPSKIPHQ